MLIEKTIREAREGALIELAMVTIWDGRIAM